MVTATELVNSTDEQLEALFQRWTTLPLERNVNVGIGVLCVLASLLTFLTRM